MAKTCLFCRGWLRSEIRLRELCLIGRACRIICTGFGVLGAIDWRFHCHHDQEK